MAWLWAKWFRPAAEPPPATDWKALGNAALGKGDLAEAARCYEQGVRAQPQDAALRLNLGFALLEQGQFAPAADCLQQALALHRTGAGLAHEAHFLLGRAQAALGQSTQALAAFAAAVQGQPDFAEPIEESIRLLHQLGRHEEALGLARRLATLRPSTFARLLLATELRECGRYEEAAEIAGEIVRVEPDHLDASVVLFGNLFALGRYPEALAEAERALAMAGRDGGALVNVAACLEKLGRLEQALARLEEALAIDGRRRDARVNHVSVLIGLLRLPEAIASARAGLAHAPDDADLHWGLSICHLLLGEFEAGWRESEWRTRSSASRGKAPQLAQPLWQGEELRGHTIFLYGEQGFGDNLQFVRFVPEIARRAQTVLLQVPELLEPLMGELAPNCRLLRQGERLPAIDFHSPLMSLPAVLGTREDTIPAAVPYLRADPARVRAWRERLAGDGRKTIGIAWSGKPTHVNDHNRSMTLATFRALAAEGCRFVTLQPQLREADRALLAQWPEALDLGREMRDFADTAALVEALDLVVSVDTGVAHLAGALGKPVWILLPHAPDWRWMLERADTPWYPGAKLYRQPQRGDWASVLARVKSDLGSL